MERRNAEKQDHEFEQEFVKACNLYDMQGLLIGDDQFTAAVEAFTLTAGEHIDKLRTNAFTDEEWLAKLYFADSLNAEFHVFLHREGTASIYDYDITIDGFKNNTIVRKIMTENEFVVWWRQHKRTIQTKEYRPELRDVIEKSYFDRLLESNGLKWGGNIDGFMLASDENHRPVIVLENRFTNNRTIKAYDPLAYYDEDIQTWKPLILLCQILNIPCILCTYSKRENEERIMGMSRLIIQEQEAGRIRFTHKDGIPPCKNLFTDIDKAKNWLFAQAGGSNE